MAQEKHSKIVIIGAGISGISAAKILFENGMKDVTILEATNRVGGRIHTTDFGRCLISRFIMFTSCETHATCLIEPDMYL